MNISMLVKANFLILGLSLCLYAIYSLNNDGLPQSVTDIIGLPSTQKIDYLTWCDTRTKKLHLDKETSVFQKGTRWYSKKNNVEKPVDSIAMEKWFSKYCRISVSFLKNKPSKASFSDKLGIEFINGIVTFFKTGEAENTFQWQSRYFKSENLKQAIQELNDITK